MEFSLSELAYERFRQAALQLRAAGHIAIAIETLRASFAHHDGCRELAAALQATHLPALLSVDRYRTYLDSDREQLWAIIDDYRTEKLKLTSKSVHLYDEHGRQGLKNVTERSAPCTVCMTRWPMDQQTATTLCNPKTILVERSRLSVVDLEY